MKLTHGLFLLFTAATFASAAPTTWKIDRAHSGIQFSVAHMVISDVTGNFGEFDAAIVNSKEDFSDAKISVSIKTKSINTDNAVRDKHLRSADFFNADVDSIITFTTTSVQKIGDDHYTFTGDLSMHGVTKSVALDTRLKGVVKGAKRTVAGFKATTTISRTEWGLTWNRAMETGGLLVGEKVELTINAEFIQQ